jgi:hypothetical protein
MDLTATTGFEPEFGGDACDFRLPGIYYFSALYSSPFSTCWFVITFGTDTGLTTGPGWNDADVVDDLVSSAPSVFMPLGRVDLPHFAGQAA